MGFMFSVYALSFPMYAPEHLLFVSVHYPDEGEIIIP